MKGVKTFNFSNNKGKTLKVKFYSTSVYTITDSNGEHECGMWEKKPMLVGRYNDTPSKDPNNVVYFATSFAMGMGNKLYRVTQYTMRELASLLLDWEIMTKTIQA